MPIIMRHNADLELSRVEYFGVMRAADLHANAVFNADNPGLLGFDCISVIRPDLDVAGLSLADLDGVFKQHRALFAPLNLMFMRRSAWVCDSHAGQRLLSHWLTKRNADRSPWADVRQFDSIDAAAEWMLLGPDALHALKSGDGFAEIGHFDHGAAATP